MLTTLPRKLSHGLSALRYPLDLVSHHHHLPALSTTDLEIATELKQKGACITSLAQLGLPSTPTLLAAAQTYLQMMKSLQSSGSATYHSSKEEHDPAYPHIFTVTDLPEFANWGSNPRLLNIVENYIGLPVKFQGVHLRRDFPNEKPITTGLWHWDLEDRRMVKIFVYLTDATDEYGPLEYIPKEYIPWWMQQQIWRKVWRSGRMGLYDEEVEAFVPRSHWRRCSAPAGSVVFADPAAVFHRGSPRQRERDTLFFVYTAAHPLRPGHVLQYHDDTFPRPDKLELS